MASIETVQLTPPVPAAVGDAVVELLRHKGQPWVDDIRRRLSGAVADASDHYFVARCADELVGHVWYTTHQAAPELGLIGHIYTAPEWRRRGVAAQLVDAALTHFRQSGGRLLQLYTSTPYTLDFYRRFGFEELYRNQAYHAMDWYMCAPVDARRAWPAPNPAVGSMRALSPGALPQYCLLYNSEHTSLLKDRAQQIGMGLEAELAFIQFTQQMAMGNGVCYVLDDDHALAAIATLRRMEFPHQSHIAVLDCYAVDDAADNALESLEPLVDRCLQERERLGVELVYAMAVDATKQRLFQQLGWQQHAVLSKHYRVAQSRYDLVVYRAA